jgi:hypothetical protein
VAMGVVGVVVAEGTSHLQQRQSDCKRRQPAASVFAAGLSERPRVALQGLTCRPCIPDPSDSICPGCCRTGSAPCSRNSTGGPVVRGHPRSRGGGTRSSSARSAGKLSTHLSYVLQLDSVCFRAQHRGKVGGGTRHQRGQ